MMVVIGVDRLMAVANPLKYVTRNHRRTALIAGTAQFVVVQLDSVSFDNVEDYYGLGVVLLGLVQRLGAYGKETVAAIESRYS